MKLLIFPLVVAFLLCACASGGPRKIAVDWPPGYTYVPDCKPLVRYQGTSFQVQGVVIPVPALGGSAEIGGISIDPKVLNQAFQTTQTLDMAYRADCQLLPSYSTDRKSFERALRRMQESQTKLAQLALSLQGAQPPSVAPSPGASVKPAASATPAVATKTSTTQKLAKWVDAYAKKNKAAVIEAPARSNTALGLPPAEAQPR